MKGNIVFKGGTGSGNFGHAGRPGKHGGSAPKSGVGAAMSIRTGKAAAIKAGYTEPQKTSALLGSYETFDGDTILKIAGGQELPSKLIDDIVNDPDADGMTRFIYNTKTNTYHVATKGLWDVDHGDFVIEAMDGVAAKSTEEVQVRGVFDLVNHSISIYDFTDSAELFASEENVSVAIMQKRLNRNMDKIYRNLPRIDGRELSVDLIPLEDLGL